MLIAQNYDLRILKIQYNENSVLIYVFHYKDQNNYLFKNLLNINRQGMNIDALQARRFYGLNFTLKRNNVFINNKVFVNFFYLTIKILISKVF